MDNTNRPHLNLGTNDTRMAPNDRTYPTTPSTFPQPVFPGQQAGGSQQYNQAYAQSGNYYQQNHNDPNTGLAHQFAHQNIGSAGRASPYGSRGPSPAQRPRTSGNSGQQQTYGNYLSAPMPSNTQTEFAPLPSGTPTNMAPMPTTTRRSAHSWPLTSLRTASSAPGSATRGECCSDALLPLHPAVIGADTLFRQSEMEQKLGETNDARRRESIWSTAGRKEGQYLRFLRTKDKPENYQTIKIIGKGAFGEVKLVQKKADGKVYAMKSLIKTEMFKKDQLAHVRAERDILAESDSPWVVKLYTTFQDANFLYMLMEFLPGGDLMTMLIKYEIFSEDITRFYIAEIVLAIDAVHKLGFIHRDIKPDNILLDRGGHVKLTDFGLSTGFHKLHDNNYYTQLLQGKSNKPRDNRNSVAIDQINLTVSNRAQINDWRRSRRLMAYSTVGTPDYIAPEIFTGHGYSFDCDWWSLGTIMFECLVGWPPFCAEDSHDTYRKIVNWRHSLYFPDDITLGVDAENLIRSLICNTENRLGRGGAHEIKSHAFFRGVEFDSLRRIRAPFEPRLTSAIDTTYFPTDEIDQTDNATLLKAQQAARGAAAPAQQEESPELSLPFIGYTFKRFDNNFR
uniref:non-specific serine/threonine protein kinase n=1 Tax=Neurospora crassa TaxID=5141 RepID=Q2PJB6_NEUCS|nr:cAMP-dependent protein kinase [Neurospora crassa]